MRIAFLTYWSCPMTTLGVLNAGGMSVYILELANVLSSLGHYVDIYTRNHESLHDDKLKVGKNVNFIHLKQKEDDLYSDSRNFGENIVQHIKENFLKYDVIHAHYYLSGLSGIIIKKNLKIPLVLTFHTLSEMKKHYAGIKDEKRKHEELEIIKETDSIIASTELEKEQLIDYYMADRKKIQVIHPGLNHNIFKPYPKIIARKKLGLPINKKIILFVGRIDPIKGITLLIDAIDSLTKIKPGFADNFRVLLIGGDLASLDFWKHPEVKKIKMLITQKDLECCVKFLGNKPHEELPLYYSASDVVVLPSIYESFGLVVIEAMACKSALVVSKVGGLRYIIKNGRNGLFFKSEESEDLAKIMWRVLSDGKIRKKLGENAFFDSQKYCWKIQAEKMIKVYNKI